MESVVKRREISHHEEVDGEGSWAVSYGDMITLLLTFFIIFFTIDPKEASKQNLKLKISLIDTLNQKTSNEAGAGVDDRISVGKKNEKGIDPSVIKEWNGLAHDKGNHIIIEFPGISFFNRSKIELTPRGREALKKFVGVFMPYAGNYYVSIRAYADKRQVRRNQGFRFKDNLELTALRSIATMRVLQQAGLPMSRIRVGGYGEMVITAKELSEIPLEKRSPSSELDLARRVVLVIEPEVVK